MNFQVMQHVGGRDFITATDETTNEPLIFNDAKKAAAVAAKLTLVKGVKFQPRPVAMLIDWHKRERNRFKTGEYKPVIWTNEKWWKEIDGHFAHIGVKDQTRIAFTPDAAKGESDRQTAMLPGKYLQQFFGKVLTADEIRTYAMQHSTQFEKNDLLFATTVEEIEHVYKVGPDGSCFKGTTKGNLYGSGDFSIAYIKDAERITARTVCVPQRKLFVWPYGDRERMRKVMQKSGYRESTNCSDYAGLRLLKKWLWKGFYSDFGCYDTGLIADPKDKNFLIIEA